MPTDESARTAARLLATGEVADLDVAIRRAVELHGAPAPTRKRVRAHLRAMTQQAVGREQYDEMVRALLARAEEIMTALEATDTCTTALVGRGARGEIDGGVTLHVRAYTALEIGELAEHLVDCGYDEPAFETADTRVGRLSRLRFLEDGIEIVVTRCPPNVGAPVDRDLFHGNRLAHLDLAGLRRRLE